LLRALLVEELIRLEDHTIQRHTTVARRLLYRLRVLLFLQLLLVPLQIFVALQLVKIPALAVYPDLKQKMRTTKSCHTGGTPHLYALLSKPVNANNSKTPNAMRATVPHEDPSGPHTLPFLPKSSEQRLRRRITRDLTLRSKRLPDISD
jgi:hypothetical protein